MAVNMLQKKGYVYTNLNAVYDSYGYPIYVLLTTGFYFLFKHNYFVVELFQIFLAAITCFIVYLIARLIFSENVGLLSAFLFLTHPGLIIYSTKLHELTLVIFLFTFIFWLMLILDYNKFFNNVIMGILIGIGTLTRPTLILLLPVYCICIASKVKPLQIVSLKSFKDESIKNYILKPVLIISLSVIFLLLPWTLRNYKIHKRLIFITTVSAEQFWRGNNSVASGSGYTKEGLTILQKVPKSFTDRLYRMNEIEQFDFLYSEAFSFIRSNPLVFLKMFCKKIFYFWWFSPQVGLLYPKYWTVIYKIYYGLLFMFFIFGSYVSLHKAAYSNKVFILSLFCLFIFVSFTQALHYVELRHRWSIEAFMIMFASYGIVVLYNKFIKKVRV